ncbi:MAG: transporter [Pseudonocardia sp. SCN 73-27]|uniref:SulP family inorganic anion transporter n=1 Tax=unclassified Pseudonocardia TaxID=2619320 RepID=UPI000868F226|nr:MULTISPECIES: SulP family inorganic anion transporter [unclassified Pseudonocardia]ODU04011.1 MAG: transporter [Pseudonocardia sp. SCN 72-51]ODV07488.1 MAG: transporter [Pseudonocardia sp. SCN 73-27]
MTSSPNTPSTHAPSRSPLPHLRADLGASLVVFLVAVPLSLGIALASGAPLLAGLIAAVVGGIVAGLLGGSPLQVSGPAAGLTVIVADLVTRFGWGVTCLITVGAGAVQVLFGVARIARFAQAVPPAVVHGMLAGIGITIALAQVHVVLGGTPAATPAANVTALPSAIAGADVATVAVGAVVVVLLLTWPTLPARVRAVPGPLVAVLVATLVALPLPSVARVDLPGGLVDAIALPVLPADGWVAVAGAVLTVALVASVESLLSAMAVDRMHSGKPTRADRELLGQGAANVVSGLAGGLPVTGVIVRSAANVRAGARTRASTVLHGVWIAVFAVALAGLVESVPLAVLAALLVVVGLQLVKPADIRAARRHGDLPVYVVTVGGVLLTDLLTGVAAGFAAAGLLVLGRVVRSRVRFHAADEGPGTVAVEGTVSFLAVPRLLRVLAKVPAGSDVRVHVAAHYLDHAARDHLDTWSSRHRATGGAVELRYGAASPPRPVRTPASAPART